MPEKTAKPFVEREVLGAMIFALLCGVPAMSLNGFFGVKIPLPIGLVLSVVGGVVGGVLICKASPLAGIVGGLIAGPGGLTALYLYSQHRQEIWNVEAAAIVAIGALPGIAVGYLIYRAAQSRPDRERPNDFQGFGQNQ